jgi:hypothetical protein
MYAQADKPDKVFVGLVQQNCLEGCQSGVLEGGEVRSDVQHQLQLWKCFSLNLKVMADAVCVTVVCDGRAAQPAFTLHKIGTTQMSEQRSVQRCSAAYVSSHRVRYHYV